MLKLKILKKDLSSEQIRGAGEILVLMALVAGPLRQYGWPVHVAIGLLVLNLLKPSLFTPFAWVWYGLGDFLGFFVSRAVMAIIFFMVVTPIAMIRRALGHDVLRLKQWKSVEGSVFSVRDHVYQASDLEHPF